MKSWLVQLSESGKTDEQILAEVVDTLPRSELSKLAFDLGMESRPTQVEEMKTKVAAAHRMGVELAYERADVELEKDAWAPLLAAGARMLGGQGLKGLAGNAVKSMGKDMAVNAATNKLTGALKPQGQMAAGPMQGGGFKYAGVMANLGRQAAGFAHKNPGAALTLGGAAVGAMTAPRDPQTGEKQYMRGALMGGGIAAGANALSKGQIADKGLKMVTRQKDPIFGQGARRYMIESRLATDPNGGAATALARQAPSPGAAAATRPAPPTPPHWQKAHQGVQQAQEAAALKAQGPRGPMPTPVEEYRGGPVMGQVKAASVADYIANMAIEKFANRQTLTYDPATKTFTRQHMTADTSMGASGKDVIPAGHKEPVAHGAATRGEYANQVAPAGTPPSRGTAQVHSLHGGDVLSSTPRPGVAARPMGTPPPVPAAAMKPKMPAGGIAGLAGGAVKPKLPSLGGAVSLAGGLKKIARKK